MVSVTFPLSMDRGQVKESMSCKQMGKKPGHQPHYFSERSCRKVNVVNQPHLAIERSLQPQSKRGKQKNRSYTA